MIASYVEIVHRDIYEITNGLYISWDFSILFQLNKITINPISLRVELSKDIMDDEKYADIRNKKIEVFDDEAVKCHKPEIIKNLWEHYYTFQRINKSIDMSESFEDYKIRNFVDI